MGAAWAGPDLAAEPLSVPGSRFVVAWRGGRLSLYWVRYEVPLEECLVLRLPCPRPPRPDRAHLARVTLSEAVIAVAAREARLAPGPGSEPVIEFGPATGIHLAWEGGVLAARAPDAGGAASDFGAVAAAADAAVARWMELAPHVRPDRQATADQCWWTLGANLVDLPRPGSTTTERAVVPSKLGYVGLWQWDAYFIATGLRHGDPTLAATQIDLAFSPVAGGQLPDVVHDAGVLASSADLPPADQAKLRADGERAGLRGEVPLTKPPLAAWAATRVLDALPPGPRRTALARRWFDVVRGSQDWWFAASAPHGDGVPAYLHPYSSGLDDSPIFDGGLPLTSPDLLAYLIDQDEKLAAWGSRYQIRPDGGEALGERLMDRARRTRAALGRLWDEEEEAFWPRGPGGPVAGRTIVSLLACFAGGLPVRQVDAIVRDITDPSRFASPWALPTVALDHPAFDAERMWRGPVWVNTTYLVAEGLDRCGRGEVAERLRAALLDGVERAGGPVEYANPFTGRRCRTATTAFAWSAALYLDVAVREARG
jgi:hypothetical protein